MISIVTAYYNRKELFKRTLYSIKGQKSPYLLEVIAVDDGSDDDERIEDLVTEFPFLKVIRLEKYNKWYHNSCVPFNIGFKAAKGDKVIMQNPECLHYDNILNYTEHSLSINHYLSFGCFSLDKPSTDGLEIILPNKGAVERLIASNNHTIKKDGQAGWYNHSIYRPEALHFCTAICKADLDDLGGFDELFAFGIAFDDNEFVSRVRKKGMVIKFVDEKIVLHQNHYSETSSSYENRRNKELLFEKNRRLFEEITSKKNRYSANRLWKDIKPSWRRYLIANAVLICERQLWARKLIFRNKVRLSKSIKWLKGLSN